MIEQKTKDEGFVTVATKVPRQVAELLHILAAGRGMEVYELLQLLINAFISAAKHDGPVPPGVRLLIESLKIDTAYCKAFNFASPTAVSEIAQMVLILQQRDQQGQPKHGFGMVMINKPFMDDARMTYCVDDILERIVEVAMRGLYRELRQIGVAMESESMRETLTKMCDDQKIANLTEQDREELPGYGNFHDYGKAIEYGKKTKRKPHRTPDSLANSQQQRIIFDDDDRAMADYEAQEWEGERRNPENDEPPEGMPRPFDQEW